MCFFSRRPHSEKNNNSPTQTTNFGIISQALSLYLQPTEEQKRGSTVPLAYIHITRDTVYHREMRHPGDNPVSTAHTRVKMLEPSFVFLFLFLPIHTLLLPSNTRRPTAPSSSNIVRSFVHSSRGRARPHARSHSQALCLPPFATATAVRVSQPTGQDAVQRLRTKTSPSIPAVGSSPSRGAYL